MNKVFLAVLACCLLVSGCISAPLIIAATAGGVGVYAAGKDTIVGDSDLSYETLWRAAETVARARGTIVKQDYEKGTIEAVEGKNIKIWITFERLTTMTTRMKVASRKYKMPHLELAQTMYTKILDQAKTTTK